MQPPRQAEPSYILYMYCLCISETAKNIHEQKLVGLLCPPPLSAATNENIRGSELTNRNVSDTFRSMRSAESPADQWHGASGGRAHEGDIPSRRARIPMRPNSRRHN